MVKSPAVDGMTLRGLLNQAGPLTHLISAVSHCLSLATRIALLRVVA